MNMKTKTRKTAWATALAAAVLFLSACGAAAPAEPTLDPNLIFTQVAETVMVSMTQTAEAVPPTAIPEPTIAPPPTQQAVPTIDPNIPTQAPQPIGPTPTVQKFGDSAIYQSNNPADGSTYSIGEKLNLTQCWKNDGSTEWTTSYYLHYVGGYRLWNNTSTFYVGETVEPGDKWCFTLPCVMPYEPGSYKTDWAFKNAGGQILNWAYFAYKVQ